MNSVKVKCTDSDCKNDLHCFKFLRRKMEEAERGNCRDCGASDIVDWNRLHQRNLKDLDYTFTALRNELIRSYCWNIDFDQKAKQHARNKGLDKLKQGVRNRIEKSLAPAHPVRDGFQTPFSGNCIFYAQHATACCCRTCLEYWHGITKGRALSEEEITYCSRLVENFLTERLSNLEVLPDWIRNNKGIGAGR